VRQDAFAKAHPLVVEQPKPANERGFYLHPELYRQPEEKQTEWARHPRQLQRMKAQQEAAKTGVKIASAGELQPSRDHPASAVGRNFIAQSRLAHGPEPKVKP
jgi:hypothetical protein